MHSTNVANYLHWLNFNNIIIRGNKNA